MNFNFLKGRALKYGSNTLLAVLIFLAILAVVNFLSNKYRHRFDLTEGGLQSLSNETVSLLKGLKKDVRVVAFYRQSERGRIEQLLKDYAYHTGRVSYEVVDPDKNPARARRYNIRQYRTTVLECGDREERVIADDEKSLTNALVKVTRDRQKAVYFLTGHGENDLSGRDREGMGVAGDRIRDLNYILRDSLLLARDRSVPEDCSVLVVAGPKKALFPAEADSVRAYLERGGKALIMLDPDVESGLEGVLGGYQVKVGDDFVLDNSGIGGLFGLDASMPVAVSYADHEVTGKLKGIMTTFMLARSVSAMTGVSAMDAQATEVVKTSDASWAESDLSPIRGAGRGDRQVSLDPADRKGPISLAVAVTAKPKTFAASASDPGRTRTRLVAFGDSDFATNQFFKFQGNGDLFLNALNWLLEEEDLIAIRPKDPGFNPIYLTKQQGDLISYLTMAVIPGLVFAAGIAVWWRRR